MNRFKSALQTLVKQNAVRGMMPYWERIAMATPFGFSMWSWKAAESWNITVMWSKKALKQVDLCGWAAYFDLGHLHGASQWNHHDKQHYNHYYVDGFIHHWRQRRRVKQAGVGSCQIGWEAIISQKIWIRKRIFCAAHVEIRAWKTDQADETKVQSQY